MHYIFIHAMFDEDSGNDNKSQNAEDVIKMCDILFGPILSINIQYTGNCNETSLVWDEIDAGAMRAFAKKPTGIMLSAH